MLRALSVFILSEGDEERKKDDGYEGDSVPYIDVVACVIHPQRLPHSSAGKERPPRT